MADASTHAGSTGHKELTLAEQTRVVAGLMHSLGAAQPVQRVELIETHISFVLLAGEFAYKLKKCVNLGFLNFTTLAQRRHFCEEELRLNRRIAPHIYLDIVPVTCEGGPPSLGGTGVMIDVALRMRAFEQEGLWEQRVQHGTLEPGDIDALAQSLCALHRDAAVAAADSPHGTAALTRAPVLETLDALEALLGPPQAAPQPGPPGAAALADLRAWEAHAFNALQPHFAQRRAMGRVRECHGDLHLGNVTTIDGLPTMFDCLEFDAGLRWTDVMSDVAFMAMDLHRHARADLARRFVNAYFELSGDCGGARVLGYYMVYRALVRAKIAALRGAAAGAALHAYLDVARLCSVPGRPLLIITHGFSGSGKTTWTGLLLEVIGAIRVRADVERKRLAGLAPLVATNSALRAGLYTRAHDDATHERLRDAAKAVLQGGFSAILDATFLTREPRDQARALARELGVRLVILDFEADIATLRQRVMARSELGADASEAGIAVLDDQIAHHEPLGADERADERVDVWHVDARQPWSREGVAAHVHSLLNPEACGSALACATLP